MRLTGFCLAGLFIATTAAAKTATSIDITDLKEHYRMGSVFHPVVKPAPTTRPVKLGAGSSGGGDFDAFLKQAPIPEVTYLSLTETYRQEFINRAKQGLGFMKQIAGFHWKFAGKELTEAEVLQAEKILSAFENSQGKFDLNPDLVNPETHEARVAENYEDGSYILNPVVWSMLKNYLGPSNGVRFQIAIALHELLSHPSLRLESTGHFDITKNIVALLPAKVDGIDMSKADKNTFLVTGVAGQGGCGPTDPWSFPNGIGALEIKTMTKGIPTFTWYDVDNPILCTKVNKALLFSDAPIVDLAFQGVMGVAPVATYLIRCDVIDKNLRCGILDFQILLNVESKKYFQITTGTRKVHQVDHRTRLSEEEKERRIHQQ